MLKTCHIYLRVFASSNMCAFYCFGHVMSKFSAIFQDHPPWVYRHYRLSFFSCQVSRYFRTKHFDFSLPISPLSHVCLAYDYKLYISMFSAKSHDPNSLYYRHDSCFPCRSTLFPKSPCYSC